MYDISVGDKFYFNNSSIKIGASLPDILQVTKLIALRGEEPDYFEAQYINHYVDTRPRTFSMVVLDDSNLNKEREDPSWIFLKGDNK